MLLFCFVCFLKYLRSVQKQTIPALLAGRDAVVRSQTGSGESPVVPDTAGLCGSISHTEVFSGERVSFWVDIKHVT